MLRVMSEWGQMFTAAAFCAVAVKLLDDFLDRETDAACGEPNLINQLGVDTIAYCLPFLAASVGLQPTVGISLFFASWAVGMYHDLTVTFSLGMRGWQESLIVTITGAYFAGWRAMLSALFLVGGVQLFDDIIDRRKDRMVGMRNLAQRWGVLPCSIVCVICLLAAWRLLGLTFWPVLTGIAVVYAAFAWNGGLQRG